jgi:hypothetical protein
MSASCSEAGYLLKLAFPSLTLEQADQILTETEGPAAATLTSTMLHPSASIPTSTCMRLRDGQQLLRV